MNHEMGFHYRDSNTEESVEKAVTPEDFLPLPSSEFRVLLTLGDNIENAYRLFREGNKILPTTDSLSLATTYRAINKLVEQKLLGVSREHEKISRNGLAVHSYKATELGKQVCLFDLARRVEEVEAYVKIGINKNIVPPSEVLLEKFPQSSEE